jgi:hypothetical protein
MDSKDDELLPLEELRLDEAPTGVDRRAFMMRSALIGATAVLTGCAPAPANSAPPPQPPPQPAAPAMSPDLNVVKKAKGPVMTTIDEFYKVGPGPSSSHTIGPMRITYDFYQRCTKLPPDQLAKVTGLKVHLYGSGAVKASTGFMIASNEIPTNRRVDFDTTVSAMALTAKEMNSKYKETSEGGLAVSVTLC